MGQVIGRAPIQPQARPFVNLPCQNIHEIWEAFNDIAEGFGLTKTEFQEILRVATKEYTGHPDRIILSQAEALFVLFDDDKNSLVDSLEFLSATAIVSAMPMKKKLWFVFGVFDFDESGLLTVDEMILALRAAMSGLCKIAGVDKPSISEIDVVATGAFVKSSLDPSFVLHGDTDTSTKKRTTITKDEFVSYAMNSPELISWMEYFGDFEEIEESSNTSFVRPVRFSRSEQHQDIVDKNLAQKLHQLQPETYKRLEPWQHVADLCEPSSYETPQRNSLPRINLNLDWIHGRNVDSKAFYTHDGSIIYSAGATVVKSFIDKENSKQSYFMGQSDHITALAIWHNDMTDSIIAVSQLGEKPAINIWSSSSMKNITTLSGFHKNGVSHLDFCPSGELIVSVGMDEYNSIAVYKWQERCLIFSSTNVSRFITDCRFLGSSSSFGICGDKFVHFWSYEGKKYSYCRQRGIFGRKESRKDMTCIIYFGHSVVTGTINGDMLVWEDRNCVKTLKNRTNGAITAMHAVKPIYGVGGGLCVATSDGKINIWNESLELWTSFTTNSYGGLQRGINTICWDPSRNKILIGLESSDLFEINDMDGSSIKTIVDGHSGDQIWGIASNPIEPTNIVTIGSDKTVRIWNTKKCTMMKMVVLDTMACCVSYNHDGTKVALGLGSSINDDVQKKGAITILRETDLMIMHEARDTCDTLTDCKFSKNGKVLAYGCDDGCIYIYDASDYTYLGKAIGHKGAISSFDFGIASDAHQTLFIRSNSSTGELLFWNTVGEQQIARTQKDVKWETHSCLYCWSSKAIHGLINDGISVQACAVSKSGKVLACVDNIGRIRIYTYPVLSVNQYFLAYKGHSAAIKCITFTANDDYLISVGGDDLNIFQWKYSVDVVEPIIKTDERSVASLKRIFKNPYETWDIITNDDMSFMFAMEEKKSDQNFAPTKPWRRTICAPSNSMPPDNSEPDGNLSLEWINGYSAEKCRGNLLYGDSGQAIYNVGKNVVVYDTKKNAQQFYRGAVDEISCIALHNQKYLCAVGQAGSIPNIHIFNYKTQETYKVIKGQHKQAISAIEFDKCGRYLVTCGQDDDNTVIMYDIENDLVIASVPTGDKITLDLEFHRDNSFFIQCGDHILRFWTLENDGKTLNFKDAYFGDKGQNQVFHAIGYLGNFPMIGTDDGYLYRFSGRKLEHAFRAHNSAIYTIYSTNGGIITGSKDGKAKIWTQSLQCRLSIDMMELGSRKKEIKSVCWSNELESLLVGTLSNEIWEISASDGSNLHSGPLERCHFGENSSGLAISPTNRRFVTTSDDKILRLWNSSTHGLMKSTELEMKSRACCYSPDGGLIVVGYGTPRRETIKTYDGKWTILNETDFNILHETRDSKKYVSEIKWSQNGQYIAVGNADNKIYIYKVDCARKSNIKISLSSIIDQHNANISHFDFSYDGKYLQSNCSAYELFFFEVETGLHIPGASRLKDVEWETQTCVLGWNVQSVWPPQNDETDITSLDCCKSIDGNMSTVAVGDNYGILKLFSYPCTLIDANSKRFKAHLGSISKVRWISNSHLVTVGGYDQSIMHWKYATSEVIPDESTISIQPERIPDPKIVETTILSSKDNYSETMVGRLVESDKKLSRQWIASMVPPSEIPSISQGVPKVSLELRYAHGLQLQYLNNALVYNTQGNLVFSTSNMCIVQDRCDNKQIFFRKHEYQISCLASSTCRRYIATGEFALRPKIKIWDSHNCSEIGLLKEFHRKGIIALSFDTDSKRLVSIGDENEHMVCVWRSSGGNWNQPTLEAWATSGTGRILFGSFTSSTYPGFLVATGGINHIKFWNLQQTDLISTKGVFGSVGKVQSMLCGASIGEQFVTGTPSGHLYLWRGRKLEKIIKAHDGKVNVIRSSRNLKLVTGSDIGHISIWSSKFERLRTFHLSNANIPPMNPCLRSLDIMLNESGQQIMKILIGTKGSEIYEISTNTGNMILIHEGHYEGECWGLAMHPNDPDIFATSGDDQTIRLWSVSLNRLLRKAKVGCPVRSISWSNEGRDLLVGCGNGKDGEHNRKDGIFMILDIETMRIKVEGRDSKKWITDVKYSPDSKTFALTSSDENIYIYENSKKKNHALRTVIEKHNDEILGIDYSSDSCFIGTCSKDHEQHFHTTKNGEYVSHPSQLKDIEWASNTCTFGWALQGIWPSISEQESLGTPTCVHTTSDNKILVTGDNCGKLKLYDYPVLSKEAKFRSTKPHTDHIAKCRFSCDNSTLVTIGRADRSVLVWEIKRNDNPNH